MNLLLVPSLLLIMLVAFFAPDDILQRFRLLEWFCSPVVEFIPSVKGYVRVSKVPEVTTLVLSIVWWNALLVAVPAYLLMGPVNKAVLAETNFLAILSGLALVVSLFFVVFALGPTQDVLVDGATRGQRSLAALSDGGAGLAFWAALFNVGVPALLVFAAKLFLNLPAIWSARRR